MNVTECPSEHLLKHYLSGRLDLAAHEVIDQHLEACPGCQSTADGLDSVVESSFPGLKPVATAEPPRDDPAFHQLVERVKTLWTGTPTNGVCETGAGMVLGNYLLLEPIGGGGMGRVFKARHRLMKRIVAVKVLSPELFRSAGARARFQREVEAAARLTHPHIVAAHDAGEAEGRDFLVMEYVEGQNLSERVKRDGPLPLEQALAYIAQAARGLAFAHAAGIIHRDVKPANLLVDADGVVKVLDMGLARLPLSEGRDDEPGLTSTGVVMGTAAFMAPEQAADTHRADERSDVYSLGCCLFFLLTGRAPYEGRTPMEILFAHREQPIPSLRQARPHCPPAVEALFREMVAKKPEDRPASMTTVLAQLEALPRTAPKAGRRRWMTVWLVAACILVAAVSVGVWAWPRPERAAVPAPTENKPPVVVRVEANEPPVHVEPPPIVPAPLEHPKRQSVETVRVAAGRFQRGSPDSDRDAQEDEKPRKQIGISHDFYLAKYKVTQALFQEVMGKNPSTFGPSNAVRNKMQGDDTSNYPVESVPWLDAVAFCNRLSERDELPLYYRVEGASVTVNGGDGWRLPTEVEWEYACRAGTDTRWNFGADPAKLGDYAWFAGNSNGVTHPVGLKAPNAWGLFDMHGNVPEWCWDRYDPKSYQRDHAIDPTGAAIGETRVFRGGGWNDDPAQLRSASRQSLGWTYGGKLTHVGFRVARDARPL